MNRRNFLKSIGKICAVLPFVGSSSAVAKAGASEGQRKQTYTYKEIIGKDIDGTLEKRKRKLTKAEFQDALTEVIKGKFTISGTTHYDGEYIAENNRKDAGVGIWKFYINGKEVYSSRAIDEHSVLSWSFQ